MKQLLLVFAGGGLGSCCRFLCAKYLPLLPFLHPSAHSPAGLFPWATFAVNLSGSLLIGLCYALARHYRIPSELLLLLTTGFCGGFTTFSTLSNEMLSLLRGGHTALFALYALLSFSLGLGAVFLGHKLGDLL